MFAGYVVCQFLQIATPITIIHLRTTIFMKPVHQILCL